jgi:hypothetical protein
MIIVLYYSNDILSNSLPEFGAYISLGITMINVIMTFPPIILIEVTTHSVLREACYLADLHYRVLAGGSYCLFLLLDKFCRWPFLGTALIRTQQRWPAFPLSHLSCEFSS